MSWPSDDLEYDAPGTDAAREGFSAGARKPWRQGIYNLVGKVKAILAARGVQGGVASLDATGRLPSNQLTPHTHTGVTPGAHTHSQYLLASARGAASGVASLGSGGKVPTSQIPDIFPLTVVAAGRIRNSGGNGTPSWVQRYGMRSTIGNSQEGTYNLMFSAVRANTNYLVLATTLGQSGEYEAHVDVQDLTTSGFNLRRWWMGQDRHHPQEGGLSFLVLEI